MEIQPQERKDIYLRMLDAFKKDKKYVIMTGFCAFLAQYRDIKREIESYPELMLQKPTRLAYGTYWWSIQEGSKGRKNRIAALKRALKLINKIL